MSLSYAEKRGILVIESATSSSETTAALMLRTWVVAAMIAALVCARRSAKKSKPIQLVKKADLKDIHHKAQLATASSMLACSFDEETMREMAFVFTCCTVR